MTTKEYPILFNGEMVRAILDGRKTQTRRVIKLQPVSDRVGWGCIGGQGFGFIFGEGDLRNCPYGQTGDRLWVRESFRAYQIPMESAKGGTNGFTTHVEYKDGTESKCQNGVIWENKPIDEGFGMPSIHMPRWASRIDLENTGVRVERLQDISEEDAIAEGVNPLREDSHRRPGEKVVICTAVEEYQRLWDSTTKKPEFKWDASPWVWVIEFKAA